MKLSLREQFEGFIATPQIFAADTFFEYPLFETTSSVDPKQIEGLTEPTAAVLGKRMEHFFEYYITHFSSLEVLAHNRQVIQEKQTLGELDFLLKDSASGELSHVELIYKFYLYDPATGTSEKDHLIGPNRRDSLNRKLNRLQKRQFPLLFHPETKKLLDKLKISAEDVVQKMCFKAFVFLPKQMQKITFSEINPQTISGYWIKAAHFTAEDYGKNKFYTPKKKFWPIMPHKNSSWYSYREILEQIQPFLDRQLTPLLWMKKPEGTMERFFVVWW